MDVIHLQTHLWEKILASAPSCQVLLEDKEEGLESLYYPTMGHFQR